MTNACEFFTRCEEFVRIIHTCEKIRSVNIKVQQSFMSKHEEAEDGDHMLKKQTQTQ